jgi:hypothetical protein
MYRIISKSFETHPPTHLKEKKEVFIMFRMHQIKILSFCYCSGLWQEEFEARAVGT